MKNNLHFLSKVADGLRIMKAAMSLVAALLLMPQEAVGRGRWWSGFLPGGDSWNMPTYNASEQTVTFKVCVYDAYSDDAGFDGGKGGALVQFSKDGGNSFKDIFLAKSNQWGDMSVTGLGFQERGLNGQTGYFTCDAGSGTVYSWWGTDDNRWVTVTIYLNRQWLNCNIIVKAGGNWVYYLGGGWVNNQAGNVEWKIFSQTIQSTYPHQVRQINWNGGYSVSSDGTVTIPYSFEGASRNTDGETHICTMIDGSYNGTIGYRYSDANYSNGSYSFRLSDIGKGMTSQFNIEPYHEFTHYNDKDAGGGTKYYATFAGPKTFMPLPVATIQNAEFQQAERQVVLTWTASNTNYGNGKWVIYRNNTKIVEIGQNVYSYTDKSFANESDVKYKIYYVLGTWNTDVRLSELGSNEFTVNTTRHVPVSQFNAGSQSDRIALTWKSDSLPAGWGQLFYLYVDNEATPVDTIIPAGGQTSFRWEHRTTDQHTNRQNGMDGTISYVEEPLTATNPHNYKVVGAIGNARLDSVTTDKIGIGTGTTFYSMEASKNSYAGLVKLAWHVNRQGSEVSQTYTVYRRRAEKATETWTRLDGFSSTDDYLFYTDNTPLPGVCYEYRIRIEEKRPDGRTFTNDTTDVGFAQASATISGRITFGSSGMAVQGVEVEARQIGEGDGGDQYHAIRFTGVNGLLTWNYPTNDYASGIFATQPWSIQMWFNPDTLQEQTILQINGTECYVGMNADGRLVLVNGSGIYTFGNATITAGQYSHITLARSGAIVTCYVRTDNIQDTVVHSSITLAESSLSVATARRLTLGGFKGYVDEFRLWTKCLTESEIKDNYDHLLIGSERNLETYWPFDEGLNTQFFDYARDGSVYRSHHGKMEVNTKSSSYTPDRLALRARTDSVGNYIIRGVPFSGEGTTYAIVPTLGIHSFNPPQQLR